MILSTNDRCCKPFEHASDRSGGGPPPRFLFNLIFLALLAVPHGGAIKIPITRGLSNHFLSKVCPFGDVKSIKEIGAQQFFGRAWSTPKADDTRNGEGRH